MKKQKKKHQNDKSIGKIKEIEPEILCMLKNKKRKETMRKPLRNYSKKQAFQPRVVV